MSMFRAIIVDDEAKVCNLILSLGDWKILGIEVAVVCHDGEDALAAIETHRPDIVISDIRMPVYDGLELVRRTREAGIPSEFIIISGHKQFDYAHKALQYNVNDYLLKPIDQQELNAALAKMVNKLNRRDEAAQQGEQYSRLLVETAATERARFIARLQDGAVDDDLAGFNQKAGTAFAPGLFGVLLLNTSRPEFHETGSPFGAEVDKMAEAAFGGWAQFLIVPDEAGYFIVLNYQSGDADKVAGALSLILGRLGAMADVYGSFESAIGKGGAVEEFGALGQSLAEAKRCEQAKLLLGWGKAIGPLPAALMQSDAPAVTPEEERSLNGFLDTLDEANLTAWFAHWTARLSADMPPLPFLLTARDQLIRKLELLGVTPEEVGAVWRKAARAGSPEELGAILSDAFAAAVAARLATRQQEDGRPIRLAKQYVQQHYASPLTLEEVAAHAGFSASYFSTLFKAAEGQTFSEYLEGVRIAGAKALLKDSDKTVDEIANSVGYADSKYFRKVFKRATGMRPSEYRKLYW